jgi:hypothetical protein
MSRRLTTAERLENAVTEAELQAHILDLAALTGWRVFHDHDSRRNPAGLPDLILVRRGRLIFAELKTRKGRIRPAQKAWIADLEDVEVAAGGAVEVYVWRPGHLAAIADILR